MFYYFKVKLYVLTASFSNQCYVQPVPQAEKRAHHNALERKRRDHIKDSFYCLRDAVPQLRGEKVKIRIRFGLNSHLKSPVKIISDICI